MKENDMKTFRATFLYDVECDYWGKNKKKLQAESYCNFNDLHRKYYHLVRDIRNVAFYTGIKYIWHFYEPHVEITWYSNKRQANLLYDYIEQLLKKHNIKDLKKESGLGADWFCNNDKEREFGGKRHHLCSEFVKLVEEYREPIKKGKGINEQVKRTIHTICNPLGINYTEEAKICFSRGLICVFFRFFSFNKAVWIYTKIFRQKY